MAETLMMDYHRQHGVWRGSFAPDITLARQHLGWEPRVPLEIGLARTVEYFRDVLRRL